MSISSLSLLVLWGNENELGGWNLGGDNTTDPWLGSVLFVAKQPVANQTSAGIDR